MRLYIYIIIYVGMLYVCACTTQTLSQYNTQDIEDSQCYLTYGAEPGYCEK
jgi:hypothetical protein